MTQSTGLLFRLIGPLIEVACVILLLRDRGQGRTVAGVPVEYPLYAGLALGFALVVAGLVLSRPRGTR